MPYRPRELVIRAREAAFFLLATLDRDEMVQRFLDMYAAEFRRPASALPRTAANHPPRSNSRHDAASGSRASDTPEGASFSEERPQKPSEEKKEGEKAGKKKETTERQPKNCYSV